MDSGEYLKKITSAHITRPKYIAWLKELLDMLCEIGTVFESMDAAFSIDSAFGNQLDIIGAMIGADRALLAAPNDEDFRKLICAKIMRNMWDGTNENLTVLWSVLYPSLEMTYTDNQNMSASFVVSGIVSDYLLNLIPRGQLIPKPMGVQYNVTNRPPEVAGDQTLFAAVALYCAKKQTFAAMDAFDPDDEAWLTDEDGDYLTDENGVAMTE